TWIKLINQAILLALSVVIFVHSGLFSRSLTSPYPYPASACEFMRQHRLRGNILSTFEWGEYLIWNMAPGSKVFIDGRYDTVFPLEIVYKFALFNFNLDGGDAIAKADGRARRLETDLRGCGVAALCAAGLGGGANSGSSRNRHRATRPVPVTG